MSIQNRILGYRVVKASDLKPNEKNWRKHPTQQESALRGVLSQVGWVDAALYNVQTGRLIDGHLRHKIAKDDLIPVLDVDLTPDEEALILATFDPLSAMAEADRDLLANLLKDVQSEDAGVKALLEQIAAENRIILSIPDFDPVDSNPRLDQKSPIICPHCGESFIPK